MLKLVEMTISRSAARGKTTREQHRVQTDYTFARREFDRFAVPPAVDAAALATALANFETASTTAQDAKDALDKITAAETKVEVAERELAEFEKPPSSLDDKAIGSFSLGRTQMAFWLFLVIAAYVYIAMSIGEIYDIFTAEVITLLGISGATAAGAVILSSSTALDRVSRNFFTDILTADYAVQLQRVQALAITVVLGGVFFWVVASSFSMPTYDPMQLVLMGLVNGLYVGLKTQDQS